MKTKKNISRKRPKLCECGDDHVKVSVVKGSVVSIVNKGSEFYVEPATVGEPINVIIL